MSNNYYKDTWTKGHGDLFWKSVNFNTGAYKLQERIFRNSLLKLDKKPESVLELGAGTGRMTKIMLEVFPDIKRYDAVDMVVRGDYKPRIVDWYQMDIMGWDFHLAIEGNKYDFVLVSEMFLHIKPKDIGSLIKKCCDLLAPNKGVILNIDWAFEPEFIPGNWCWIHDYDKLYRENGLHTIFTADMKQIRQKLFCYGA